MHLIQQIDSTGIYMTVCKEYTLKSSLNYIKFDSCFENIMYIP